MGHYLQFSGRWLVRTDKTSILYDAVQRAFSHFILILGNFFLNAVFVRNR